MCLGQPACIRQACWPLSELGTESRCTGGTNVTQGETMESARWWPRSWTRKCCTPTCQIYVKMIDKSASGSGFKCKFLHLRLTETRSEQAPCPLLSLLHRERWSRTGHKSSSSDHVAELLPDSIWALFNSLAPTLEIGFPQGHQATHQPKTNDPSRHTPIDLLFLGLLRSALRRGGM